MKLSITLPNDVLITLESDDSEPVHEVLALVLGSVKTDNRPLGEPRMGLGFDEEPAAQKSSGVPDPEDVQVMKDSQDATNGRDRNHISVVNQGSTFGASGNGLNGHTLNEGGDNKLDLNRYALQAQEDLVAFCQAINPTGDMRRVVVSAEAASRFFGLEGVTADEVGELFDLIGWRRANSFTQTIRNAARSKFGWLERIPGRAGRYAATNVGRSTTLSG